MSTKKLFRHIADNKNDVESPFLDIVQERLDSLQKFLPSGSGFDAGSKILEVSRKYIKIQADFHHMDDNGFYCGWTEHIVTIKPSFDGFDIAISGCDKHSIKEYIGDVFHTALNTPIESVWNNNEQIFIYGVK